MSAPLRKFASTSLALCPNACPIFCTSHEGLPYPTSPWPQIPVGPLVAPLVCTASPPCYAHFPQQTSHSAGGGVELTSTGRLALLDRPHKISRHNSGPRSHPAMRSLGAPAPRS